MPNVGYGTDKKTRHYLPNGFKKFVVHNVKELEILMMHNRLVETSNVYLYVFSQCLGPFVELLFVFAAELTVLRLHTMFPQGRGKRLLRGQPNLMSQLPTSLLGCAAKRMNEQLRSLNAIFIVFCSEIWLIYTFFGSRDFDIMIFTEFYNSPFKNIFGTSNFWDLMLQLLACLLTR